MAEPNPPTGLESTVNGILPSTQSLMSPMVYQRPNIYGNQGITRFDDSSGVPTFTNTGRAGYDQLQGGGGATNALPQQGAGQQTALEAMAIQPGSVGGTLQGIESQRTGNAGLYKARLAASMGLTEDQYDRVMAARQQDRDITALGRQGFSTREVAGLMGASAKNYGQGTLNAARTQEALAKARKAEAEAAGGDPKAGYYNARGTKEGALAQGAQLDNQTKMHLAQLQQQLLTETDPQRRKQLTDMILAIHGKVNQQPPEFRTIGLAGGTDELGNRLPGQPYTYSGFTGQPVTSALPGPQAKTSQGVPQDGVYDVPGVGRVLVRNGQTYDAKGNLIQ